MPILIVMTSAFRAAGNATIHYRPVLSVFLSLPAQYKKDRMDRLVRRWPVPCRAVLCCAFCTRGTACWIA